MVDSESSEIRPLYRQDVAIYIYSIYMYHPLPWALPRGLHLKNPWQPTPPPPLGTQNRAWGPAHGYLLYQEGAACASAPQPGLSYCISIIGTNSIILISIDVFWRVIAVSRLWMMPVNLLLRTWVSLRPFLILEIWALSKIMTMRRSVNKLAT